MADHLLPGERMWRGQSTGLQRCTGKLWVDGKAMGGRDSHDPDCDDHFTDVHACENL